MIYVYFIQAGVEGPIKIGIAGDPDARLRNLQVAHHEELTLLAECPGGTELEADLHERFAEGCIRGEWFRVDTPGLLALIEQVRRNPPTSYMSRAKHAVHRERIEARAVRLAQNGNWDAAVALAASVPPEPVPFGEADSAYLPGDSGDGGTRTRARFLPKLPWRSAAISRGFA